MQQTQEPCNAMPTTLLHSLGGKLDHVFAGGVVDSHNRLQRVPALTQDDKALLACNKTEHSPWRYTSLSNTDVGAHWALCLPRYCSCQLQLFKKLHLCTIIN